MAPHPQTVDVCDPFSLHTYLPYRQLHLTTNCLPSIPIALLNPHPHNYLLIEHITPLGPSRLLAWLQTSDRRLNSVRQACHRGPRSQVHSLLLMPTMRSSVHCGIMMAPIAGKDVLGYVIELILLQSSVL